LNKSFLLFILIFFAGSTLSQTTHEAGNPFITSYSTQETGADVQVWSFVEDKRGIIYIGTAPGLLEYDGSSWKTIEVSNKSFARSMAIDENGRIYVGASADFGYLDHDELGELKFISLLDYIDDSDKVFSYVWTTIVTEKGIFFQTFERIFLFTPSSSSQADGTETDWDVTVWRTTEMFYYAFWLNDSYYVQQGGVGLMKMVNDSLILVPNGEKFKDDRLQVMLPYKTNNGEDVNELFLVGVFNKGLYLYNGVSFKPFNSDANAYLKQNTLYKGTFLADGSYIFATLTGGLVIMSQDGTQWQSINLRSGLPNNSVTALFVDSHGIIWSAPENYISIAEYPSPLTLYDVSLGLNGTPYDIIRFKGRLYIATSNGLSYLDETSSTLKPVSGLLAGNSQTFSLLKINNQLLAAIGTGLYSVEDDKATVIKKSVGTSLFLQFLFQSISDSNRVFAGLIDGITSFYFEYGRWEDEGRINGIGEYVASIVETEPGVLWLGTDSKGTINVKFNEEDLQNPSIEHHGIESGLPPGGCWVTSTSNQVKIIGTDGVYSYNESNGKFLKDRLYDEVGIGNVTSSTNLVEDKNGNIWICLGVEAVVFSPNPDGSYTIDKTPFRRFSNMAVSRIYPEDDGVVWFGTNENLIRYDPQIKKNYKAEYNALVRKVMIDEDSLLFGGFGNLGNEYIPQLEFEDNSLRFEYSATSYDEPSATQFQSMLEGFDKQWSSFTKETNRNYTNLASGDFTFRVKAKNIYKHESNEASFSFKIFPPWYRSWWAYTFYALILVTGIFAVDRIQRRRLTRKERERTQYLEAKLRAETAEANAKTLEAENERKKNIELLSEIGKDITARLTIKSIIDTVYENVNTMMDATVFSIGIYNTQENAIVFPAAKEKGVTLPSFSNFLDDENRPAVWCFKNKKEIFINDYAVEYKKYIKKLQNAAAGDNPESMMYLPLISKDKAIGVITAQSFVKDAYTDYHLNILRNLATYTSIALDNAEAYTKLNKTVDDLKSTQEQLVLQEKLASLGQLTAGIAHEIKNPLNFINNFAQLTLELIQELREELLSEKSKVPRERAEEIESLLKDLELNASKINEHGKRADSIVKSMLQHSRGKSGEKQLTDVNAMLEEDFNLAYHGMRAQDTTFNVKMKKEFDSTIESVNIVPQDISRVILNIISNSFYEVNKKKKSNGDGYNPEVTVTSKNYRDKVEILIRDNGNGISEKVKDKLFNPFFTTKPAGEGTGLGLSLSYDIISKGHNGDITFESESGKFTEFKITLPKNSN
jgi:signal transduction histidine kinase/ligand-binding sensor domain-containing protein